LQLVAIAREDTVQAVTEQREAQVAEQRRIVAVRLREDLQRPAGGSTVGPPHPGKHTCGLELAENILLFTHDSNLHRRQ
jgi:hypothetical protein